MYANEFKEILPALSKNNQLKEKILSLIDGEKIAGKVLEGGNRLIEFKTILKNLINGTLDFTSAINEIKLKLSQNTSIHIHNNKVFSQDWAERLIRTQLSRFYNQGIIEQLMSDGETEGYIPHSSSEDSNSNCSLHLAGKNVVLIDMLNKIVSAYSNGNFSKELKVPEHPNCTHVIKPKIN